MNIKFLFVLTCLVPGLAMGAQRSEAMRVGQNRLSTLRVIPNQSTKKIVATTTAPAATTTTVAQTPAAADATPTPVVTEPTPAPTPVVSSANCREAYRACMDDFCLLDESEGQRCACSDNINKSKSLIKEIQSIQEEADTLYTEGVERAQLGAKAKLIFGESDLAKKSSRASGLSFSAWLNSGSGTGGDLDADSDIGDNLYSMAADFCASELEACGAKAEMEQSLYQRQVVADCKAFSSYLADQKTNALANKRTAESAVHKARLEVLNTTDKYNRGECLLAYRACISDKGGCGVNFENCLDRDLLGRRANACENVLDQCMAVRTTVLKDWEAESEMILVDAAKYADRNQRATCLARIQVCLEDSCSTETNSACLTDVKVAAGICPVIDDCEEMIPGIKTVINDKLGYLRTKFCQNDIDKCLRDKCGENFTAPECLGKKPTEIMELCPQRLYPSCKNETQFDVIVQAVMLQMDYQMMQGCVNYFGEQLGRVCGTDMSCLPGDETVASLTEFPKDIAAVRAQVIANSQAAVNNFFTQFEKDTTVAACRDGEKPTSSRSKNLGTSVFNSAKIIAQIGAENRALRELESKLAELSRQQSLEEAEKNCLETYKVETPSTTIKNYSYIKSVSFEPSVRNCHVCRVQQVCEEGGEKKATSALKAAAGGLSAGASMGTMVSPGWGTAIGGIVGAVGAGALGAASGGKEEFCQQTNPCEDINM